MNTQGSLSVTAADVHAGGVHILKQVSFDLRPGELCALLGPSGSGKSTLIKVLLGLREPKTGSARFDGKAVKDAGPIGYVPQDDALHRTLTVEQALWYAALLRLQSLEALARQKRIESVCKQVGLSARLDVKIGRLSGGQRKRVSVAMELLTEPPVLILDEPTSGLDPGLEAKMMGLFRALADRGHTLLVSTHAMQSLEQCHLCLVLVEGYVAYFGPPASLVAYFGVERYEEVFTRLNAHRPDAWGRRYSASPLRDQVRARSARPVAERAKAAGEGAAARPSPALAPSAGKNPVDPDEALRAFKESLDSHE